MIFKIENTAGENNQGNILENSAERTLQTRFMY